MEERWKLVKVCRDIIRHNYSEWQERKMSEEERMKMQEINTERKARLERQRMRKEDFQKSMEKVSEDEKFLRRMEIAEIRENA